MNWLQIKAAGTKLLAAIGAIAGTVAIFEPKWGTALEGIVEAGGYLLAAGSILYGTFSPHLNAAAGLTEKEATVALNQASLAKSLGTPIIPEKRQ